MTTTTTTRTKPNLSAIPEKKYRALWGRGASERVREPQPPAVQQLLIGSWCPPLTNASHSIGWVDYSSSHLIPPRFLTTQRLQCPTSNKESQRRNLTLGLNHRQSIYLLCDLVLQANIFNHIYSTTGPFLCLPPPPAHNCLIVFIPWLRLWFRKVIFFDNEESSLPKIHAICSSWMGHVMNEVEYLSYLSYQSCTGKKIADLVEIWESMRHRVSAATHATKVLGFICTFSFF